jgi:type VI secretion system secreted protein VgrG
LNSRDLQVRPGINVHQFYSLDIPSSASAALADVYAFEGTRGMGEPTKYTIQFTHPQRDLPRSDFILKPASFVIQPPPASRWHTPEDARRVQGVITAFSLIASNHEQTMYEVTLESRLALLRNSPRTRFFLDQNEPDVIARILRENGFDKVLADSVFNFYRTYRKRPIITQWQEDDLSFITRLCRRIGIWFVCETGKHCEVVRFGDDFTHYVHDRERLTVPYQEPNGLHTAGRESVQSLVMKTKTVPAKFSVRSYSPEQPNNLHMDGAKLIRDDRTTYGETYSWGRDLEDDQDAAREAELRQEAALAEQVTYTGECDLLDLGPSCVLRLSNHALPEVKHGLLVVSMKCSASLKQGYKVAFTAIPSDRIYRMPLKEETWPRIHGVVTGTVASAKGYVGPYLDEQGRYTVSIHADRDERTPGLESCPMRLAKPFAGQGQTGFHFALEPGTIVLVGFLWGDPDRPYISQVLHTAHHTDPVVMGYPWATRHTIHTRSNNTLQMEDREGREHIKLATEHGKTQLNLGHAVDRNNKERGEGFELRSDLKGHVRAGGGMLVSTDAQPVARGHLTDMDPATDQFHLTQAQAQDLADAARAAQAEVADVKAENAWLKNELAGLKEAVIALSAPKGIGMATPDRVLVSAGKDVSVTTSCRFNVSAMKHVVIAAGEVLSLFAHRCGIKLFAARGKVQIQAQSDEIRIASDQDTTITSSKGRVVIEAKKELLLKCGGSYLRMTANGIEDATQGDRRWRAAAYDRSGPASLPADLPVLPVPAETECAQRASRAGVPFARM